MLQMSGILRDAISNIPTGDYLALTVVHYVCIEYSLSDSSQEDLMESVLASYHMYQ